jgi:putative hemolysin
MVGFETKIIVLIVLIGLSGLFSGIETALFSLNNLRVRHLLKKKVRGAETVHELKENPHRLLTTILIGNNVVNIGASALATSIAFGFSLNYAVGIIPES